MYPDDSCKPEVGRGLNKPARVTLEQAWPFCKTTRQPITDPDRLDKMGYEEKLRRSTAKIGGTFIEYDRQTGTCVFEVRVTQFRIFMCFSRPSAFSQLFLDLFLCLVLDWLVVFLTGLSTGLIQVEHFSKYKLQTDDSDEEEGGEGEGEGREGLPKRVKV